MTAEEAGQRVDNYLSSRLKGVPRSLLYRIIRKGEVRVNKGRVKPDRKLQAGDRVRIPPVRTSEAKEPVPPGKILAEKLRRAVLYDEEGRLKLNTVCYTHLTLPTNQTAAHI